MPFSAWIQHSNLLMVFGWQTQDTRTRHLSIWKENIQNYLGPATGTSARREKAIVAGETIIQKPERCSTKWNRWSPERQRRHINCFREFVPESYDSYKRPSSAGHKTSPRSHKRRAEQPEPEIFVERLPDADPPAKKTAVSPLRLSKGSRSSQWQVRLTYKVYDYSSFYYCALQSSTIWPGTWWHTACTNVHTYLRDM